MKHRFYVPRECWQGDVVRFSPEQWHQVHNVLRLRLGDAVLVFDGVEPEDRVVVLDAPASGRVKGCQPHAQEPKTRLVAYPSLLQRDKFEPVLQKLTEIGAARVVPVLSARTLVREAPDESRLTRWRSIMREATEQSRRGVIPELACALTFREAVAASVAEGLTVVAYEDERRRTLKDALSGISGLSTVSIFIGPQGGYEPAEIAFAEQQGARVVTLGSRVLRTETASPLLAALVLYELGDLSSSEARR